MKKMHHGKPHRTPWLLVLAAFSVGLMVGCQPRTEANDSDAMASASDTPQDAEASADNAAANATPQTGTDAAFYSEALQSGAAEMALAEYARGQAKSADVKALADLLARDHEALNRKLRDASGMSGHPAPTAQQRDEDARLRALRGDAFDAAWLDHMATSHDQSIARFEAAANGGGSDQARRLAADALPTLRSHRDAIERLRNGASSPASSPPVADTATPRDAGAAPTQQP